MDKAGRLVIPKPLRDQLGLQAGEVEVLADGAALRVAPVVRGGLERRAGRLVIPASGITMDDDDVRALVDAARR
ncbi:MAG TPA: AbrB/MazE/SpoVT family DNA-binding domain-containing protein [Chloroflexota bacterium]|nr:AbrB/MazE/SpoVT family DNA-binding domain-containing protein [Chloroflexota bacterium]